nr:hypothetical protein [Nanoarchaeum sp.]
MNFIKKIAENKLDDYVHKQFIKFGKGTFECKAIIDISASKAIKIKTSSEFTNELVELLANTIKDKTKITGIIFATKDLSPESTIKFQDIKNAMGVKKHIIDQELTKEQVLELCHKFSMYSVNLSFSTEYGTLKVKEKAPKSSKTPSKEDEEPKADYCVFTTSDNKILEDFAFDSKKSFKKFFAKHTFVIEDIIIPEQYKNDFALARVHAKRKGKIIREITVDGIKSKTELNLLA